MKEVKAKLAKWSLLEEDIELIIEAMKGYQKQLQETKDDALVWKASKYNQLIVRAYSMMRGR